MSSGADVGLNTNVHVGKKTFHVQTATLAHKKVVKCEIYEHGKVLTVFEYTFEELGISNGIHPSELQHLVNDIHHETASDIELLFEMSEKIKTVKHPYSNNKMGSVFLTWHMLPEAVREFETAIKHDPNFVEAYVNLGRAYLENDEPQKAIDTLKAALQIKEGFPDVFNYMGVAYTELSEFDQAFECFEQACRINEQFYEAYINRALAQIKSVKVISNPDDNDFQKHLLDDVRKAFEIIGGDSVQTYQRVFKSIQLKQYEVAAFLLHDLKKQLKKDRSIVEITDLFYLKFMFGGEGKNDDLISRYEKMLIDRIKHNSQYADLHNTLGILHIIQCRNFFLKAIDDFKKAIEINDKYDSAKKNLKLAENDGRGFLILLRAILK